MGATLFDLTYQTASNLGIVTESTATGGSTTTVVDTSRTEADDVWNKGSLWILRDAGGASAAPEGEYAVISDYALSGTTITIPALTAAVGAGDSYAISKKRYPLSLLIQKINEALRDLGNIPVTDVSSLTTAASQTEYTLPAAATDLRQVFIQTKLDTDDHKWSPLHDWRVQKSATGSASVLIIGEQAPGLLLKLVYVTQHPRLTAYSSKLDESIPSERVVYEAVKRVLLWKKQRGDNSVTEQLNYFLEKAREAEARHPIVLPQRPTRLLIVR